MSTMLARIETAEHLASEPVVPEPPSNPDYLPLRPTSPGSTGTGGLAGGAVAVQGDSAAFGEYAFGA